MAALKSVFAITLALLTVSFGHAQTNTTATSAAGLPTALVTNGITFQDFLAEVVSANLDYAARRYEMTVAQAAVAAARVFPNPKLSGQGMRDFTSGTAQRMPGTYGAGLEQTFELGGKRKYRVLAARQGQAATAASIDDFLRQLKLDASAAFAEALALARSADQKRETAGYLGSLAEAQERRFKAGDISEADMLQAVVEKRQFQNDLIAAEADAEKASLFLDSFLGRERGHSRLIPKGSLELSPREFDASQLIRSALTNRGDLIALRRFQEASETHVRLEKANRVPDVDVGVGWLRNTRSDNIISPSPQFDSAGLTFSLPLPLWNRNKAGIAAARAGADQAKKMIEAAELKTEVQIRQSLVDYRGAIERVRNYQVGILKDADTVLDARRFGYQRGESSLLELIEAQRTATEVRTAYNDALADQARSLIEVQRAAGLMDIQF